MTSVAIMQPYFLPYIGYFHLMKNVDHFVFLDNVTYIKKGWVNRNRILLSGMPHTFTLPLKNASQNTLIKDLQIFNLNAFATKFFKLIYHAYSKAPYYEQTHFLLNNIFSLKTTELLPLIIHSFDVVFSYLETPFSYSLASTLRPNNTLGGQSHLISICKKFLASSYLNAAGGKNLYSKERFDEEGINLCFMPCESITYPQFNGIFTENLSIIDALMFCNKKYISTYINKRIRYA